MATQAWLRNLQTQFQVHGAPAYAEKIEDLVARLEAGQQQAMVAFCGLFSAGKSSLLNALAGSSMLATGAVPTTSQVAQVELRTHAGTVVLMDTPGVDSTDETHQAVTQGVLHQADVIAVVMDYQHVESDANLELIRSFSDQGKRMILIVNQIDKHVDFELSFAEFQNRIERTFLDWDLHYECLFYTSSESSDYNELKLLSQWLQNLSAHSEVGLAQNVFRRVRELAAQYVEQTLSERQREVEARVLQYTGWLPFQREEAIAGKNLRIEQREVLARKYATEMDSLKRSQLVVREELVRSVELAQISPYETTEKGRFYVESLQPGFQVGWWRRQARISQEQQTRLVAFAGELAERTEKFLTLPLWNHLYQFLSRTEWTRPEWQNDVQLVRADVTAELCKGLVYPGALVSSQYPYQYVKDVVSAVKRQIFNSLTMVLDRWFEAALSTRSEELQDLEVEQARLRTEEAALQAWIDLADERASMLAKWLADAPLEMTV